MNRIAVAAVALIKIQGKQNLQVSFAPRFTETPGSSGCGFFKILCGAFLVGWERRVRICAHIPCLECIGSCLRQDGSEHAELASFGP